MHWSACNISIFFDKSSFLCLRLWFSFFISSISGYPRTELAEFFLPIAARIESPTFRYGIRPQRLKCVVVSKFDLENEAKELENYKIKLQLGKFWIGRKVRIHSTLARSVMGYTKIEEIKKLNHNLRHKKRRPVKENWGVTSGSVHWHRRAIFTCDDSMLATDINWGINSPVLFHLLQRTRAN